MRPPMSDNLVLYEVRTGTALLTINRPDRRNALSRDLIRALTEGFSRARDDATVRCVVLTGNGSAFCAGMDLAELQESITAGADRAAVWDDAVRLASLYDRIYTLPKPPIAAGNGPADAAGARAVRGVRTR